MEDWIDDNKSPKSQNDLSELSETLNKLDFNNLQWKQKFALYADSTAFYAYFIRVMTQL